mmetsp:Transcript_82587/g.130092  ORF Transcript_82587/g.130092 Transcript_82587/m.130092 type:complete len:241 (+) Transcript_82587:70-792(+)
MTSEATSGIEEAEREKESYTSIEANSGTEEAEREKGGYASTEVPPPVVTGGTASPAAIAAVVAANNLESLEEAPAPPEDLELREKLVSAKKGFSNEEANKTLTNVVKVLRRLKEEPSNTKFHEMRLDVLHRICGEEFIFCFEAAGFQSRGPAENSAPATLAWRRSFTQELESTLHEVQRAADLCLDPATLSFPQVSDMVQKGRTLPGIEDVNDKVVTAKAPKASDRQRPKKPWEKEEKDS